MAFIPALMPSLPVSSGKAWPGATLFGPSRHRPIGDGVLGAVGGVRTGREETRHSGIRPTARERHAVVSDVAGASAAAHPGRRAGMLALKFSGHFSGAMFFR
jgi:hypothetical protein